MNKIIFNELKKVDRVDIDFDEDTSEIYIPKTVKLSSSTLKVGEIYKLKLSDAILNLGPSSMLAVNWNNGKCPTHQEYLAEVIDKLGNMVKINGVATIDQTDNFYGWLPVDQIEILEIIC